MRTNAAFDALFRPYGARLDFDNLPSPARERYRSQIAFYRQFDPTIYVGVLTTQSFNALASRGPGGDFIAMHMGAIAQLTLFAYQAFADPLVCPSVGTPAVESCEPAALDRLRELDPYGAVSMRYMPNDPTRINAAERIAECACLILFLHEAAHVRGCHLDLVAAELGIKEYQEFSAAPLDERGSLLLRTLELEADTLAIANSLTIWRNLVTRTALHDIEGLDPVRAWVLAAELFFVVMSFNHQQARRGQLASHPSIVTRFLNFRLFRGQQGQDNTDLVQAIERSEDSLLLWVDRHKLPIPLMRLLDEPFDDTCTQELTELKQHAESLWPRLEEYQRHRSERIAEPR